MSFPDLGPQLPFHKVEVEGAEGGGEYSFLLFISQWYEAE